jgi:hypothetical protein
MKPNRSAVDRLKKAEDGKWRAIWIEETMHDGRPFVFYRYVNGRLKRYTRTVWGWSVTLAEIERFGEQVNCEW